MDVAVVTHSDAEREYPTETPQPGWSVLNSEVVVEAGAAVVRELARTTAEMACARVGASAARTLRASRR